MPKALVKQAAASPPISASAPTTEHAQQRPRRRRVAGSADEPRGGAEVDEELADKAVQRRQPGDGRRADRGTSRR